MGVPVILVAVVIFAIYAAAYVFYGSRLLATRVVRASPTAQTPAVTRFDGVDYVPANKYVLYGHHFASIAGAGPIVGPAIAMAYGWLLPLVWVLFGNVFVGAVHDYLALMASVRYGGISIMSISENVMGRKAKYIFLTYVYAALILVIAAFLSVAATLYAGKPNSATKAIVYMPLALALGIMMYRLGVNVKVATAITLVFVVLGFYYAVKVPLYAGYIPGSPELKELQAQLNATYYQQLVASGVPEALAAKVAASQAAFEIQRTVWTAAYHNWVIILALYAFVAASLPVWYLLQPRDYLNAYLLWFFVAMAALGTVLVLDYPMRLPAYIDFSPPLAGMAGQETPFWPAIVLIIACGALSGFHSVVASGTTSKQLASEMDALLVGYGGMLTEGAVSSLAVIIPISLAHQAPELGGINILEKDPIGRFVIGYGYMAGSAVDRLGIAGFEQAFNVLSLFAAIALATFILTTLDTATRLGRFAWQELFDWLEPRNPGLYRLLTNRWVASGIAVFLGAAMAYPTVVIGGKIFGAYRVVWPAFAGVNQLLAALALLTSALWVYAVLRVRGGVGVLIQLPAWFLWVTVTVALAWWLVFVAPGINPVQRLGSGAIVAVSLVLDILLIVLFVRGLLRARAATPG